MLCLPLVHPSQEFYIFVFLKYVLDFLGAKSGLEQLLFPVEDTDFDPSDLKTPHFWLNCFMEGGLEFFGNPCKA